MYSQSYMRTFSAENFEFLQQKKNNCTTNGLFDVSGTSLHVDRNTIYQKAAAFKLRVEPKFRCKVNLEKKKKISQSKKRSLEI